MKSFQSLMLVLSLFPVLTLAQQSGEQSGVPCMPGMQMPGCRVNPSAQKTDAGLMDMPPQNFLEEISAHTSSGTGAEPDSTPTPMLMTMKGPWMLMFHANVFVVDQQESSPRGRDKFFSTNWIMSMAQRKLGAGVFTFRTMLSLEPATITGRQYPLLFQQRETAFGLPIADGQHPHNFFMEVAALYDWKLTAGTLLSFYAAPVGDPAIGPTPFPHRAAAMEDPVAPLGHHQEDSTHIADDVFTVGLTYRIARLEASGFHGREPNENRWTIPQGRIDSCPQGRIDSWSSRLTIQHGKNWSGQYSLARIASPEALFPTQNQERMTASIMYNRPLSRGNWASIAVWGRTRSLPGDSVFNSYLFESTLRFRTRNYAWTRVESAERSNLLILGEAPLPLGFEELPIGHVQAYTLGYDHDVELIPHLASAIGAQVTTYEVPERLKSIYGERPAGLAIFLRLRPFSAKER